MKTKISRIIIATIFVFTSLFLNNSTKPLTQNLTKLLDYQITTLLDYQNTRLPDYQITKLLNNQAYAGTLYATGSATITASIPENNPPSTPILISPENNSLLTDNTPEFVWTESTDDRQVSHYQFYLDGNLLYDNIPLVNNDNASYTLTYDSLTSYYHLIPKDSLSDGSYTWKIRTVDVLDSYAESVTWAFTIDTQAPNFIITHIGTSETTSESTEDELDPHISSQDSSTLPTNPLEFEENELLLIGTGEKNSSVVLTVTIPDDPTQTFNFNTNDNGSWSQQLGILPRGVIIVLDFIITDKAGHITVLEGVEIIIKTQTIIFPPLTATPIPNTPYPILNTPYPTPSTTPESTASGILVIPYLPPKEVIHEIIQEITERIPQPISQLATAVPRETKRNITIGYKWMTPWLALLIAITLPTATILFIAAKFEQPLSLLLFKKIAYAVGILPGGPPQGIIFDDETNFGVAFSLVTIVSQDEYHLYKDSAISDQNGIFRGIKLPPGKYRLSSREDHYLFPSNKKNQSTKLPDYQLTNLLDYQITNYYQGQVFNISKENILPILLVPNTKISYERNQRFLRQIRSNLAHLNTYPTPFLMLMTSLTAIVSITYPIWSNWLVVLVYGVIWCKKGYETYAHKTMPGIVVDTETQPLEKTIIKTQPINSQSPDLIEQQGNLRISNKEGKFVMELDKYPNTNNLKITVSHVGYDWLEAPEGSNTITTDNNAPRKKESIIVMKKN